MSLFCTSALIPQMNLFLAWGPSYKHRALPPVLTFAPPPCLYTPTPSCLILLVTITKRKWILVVIAFLCGYPLVSGSCQVCKAFLFHQCIRVKLHQIAFCIKFSKSRRSMRNSWNFSCVTLRSHALRLIFRKMQDQAYDDAVNIAGKTKGVAAFMLTDNQKVHVLNMRVANACVVMELCLYHDFISNNSGERL